jgi:hypoxanthine phosphoribosyltransferase
MTSTVTKKVHLEFAEISRQLREMRLLEGVQFNFTGLSVLVVDDVSVTGATLSAAREILVGASIITLTCKGKADFVLFPEISSCVLWPWSAQ